MNPCKRMISELSNYLDNALDPELRREFDEHMTGCPDCYVVLDSTRKSIQIYRGCDPYPVPVKLRQRILDAIQKSCEQSAGDNS